MFAHLLQSLSSTSALVAELWSGAPDDAKTDAPSMVDFQCHLMAQVDRIRAWTPEEGELRALQRAGEDGELRSRTLRTVTPEWAKFVKTLDDEVNFYQSLWERLPGLRLNRIDDFAWTLTEPLEMPFDVIVQDHLAQSSAEFRKAWTSFQHGRGDQAQLHHDLGMQGCGYADAIIRCCQGGDPQQKQTLHDLYLASVSTAARQQLYAYLDEAPWDKTKAQGDVQQTGVVAQAPAQTSRTRLGTETEAATATATATSAAAATRAPGAASARSATAASSSTPAAAPVSTQPLAIRAERPILKRLEALDILLQGRGDSVGRDLQAYVLPDGRVRAHLAALDLASIRSSELDPSGRLSSQLVVLESGAPAGAQVGQAPSDSYLSALRALEASVEKAQTAQQHLREAREAVVSLRKVIKADPTTERVLKWAVMEIEKLQKAASEAGKAGKLDVKETRARQCLELATMSRHKAQEIRDGRWPGAEQQLQRCIALHSQRSKVEDGSLKPIRDRLLQRLTAQEWAFHTARSPERADAMLDAMAVTLNTMKKIRYVVTP